MARVRDFLRQPPEELVEFEETVAALRGLFELPATSNS
jgi:hypothetical protein